MSSLVTKMLVLLAVWYASICLTSSIHNDNVISSLNLDKFTSEKEVYELFEMWKKATEREYQTPEEEVVRFQVFKSNLENIKEKNAKRKSPHDCRLGLNQFSDMSYEEFSKTYLREMTAPNIKSNIGNKAFNHESYAPPSSWDWRKQGAVTAVRDEGTCDSSWAFSATGAIEGITQIVTKDLPTLSVQQLISCNPYGYGCEGGSFNDAFEYVVENQGIATEQTYPYVANDTACNIVKEEKIYATIAGYRYWSTPVSDESLLNLVYMQPISVAIYASKEFMHYTDGIFDGKDCSSIGSCKTNHAILIVGYAADGDYWIAKNSWGTTWGKNGYIHIKRNTGVIEGACNMNCLGGYPVKGNGKAPLLKLDSSA